MTHLAGSFIIGAMWGAANIWVIGRIIRFILSGKKGVPLAGWLALKFLGLYGLAVWFFLGLKVSPFGWLAGFTASLAGLSFRMRKVAL